MLRICRLISINTPDFRERSALIRRQRRLRPSGLVRIQSIFKHFSNATQAMRWSERRYLIQDSMNDRIVTFPDNSSWRLIKKLSEKPWEGSNPEDPTDMMEEWDASEAHAVYECIQLCGSQPYKEAIIKVRIE